MFKVVEQDGKQFVIIEKQIDVEDIDEMLGKIDNQIANIDHNLIGLQQRKSKLEQKRLELLNIKKGAGISNPAPQT